MPNHGKIDYREFEVENFSCTKLTCPERLVACVATTGECSIVTVPAVDLFTCKFDKRLVFSEAKPTSRAYL